MTRERDPWEEFYEREFEKDRRNVRGIIVGTVLGVVVIEAVVFTLHPPILFVLLASFGTGYLGSQVGLAIARRSRR